MKAYEKNGWLAHVQDIETGELQAVIHAFYFA